jgi:hypothetical protein
VTSHATVCDRQYCRDRLVFVALLASSISDVFPTFAMATMSQTLVCHSTDADRNHMAKVGVLKMRRPTAMAGTAIFIANLFAGREAREVILDSLRVRSPEAPAADAAYICSQVSMPNSHSPFLSIRATRSQRTSRLWRSESSASLSTGHSS